MMFNQKFVTAIKANGKVLREHDDTVFVPYGSEYSIYLKNLNTQRALVHIEIDGNQVCPDGLVIDANCDVDLERFIKDSNLSQGNRFKFIERTSSVEQHRGIEAQDGIIRVSFQFEKYTPLYNTSNGYPWSRRLGGYNPQTNWYGSGDIIGSLDTLKAGPGTMCGISGTSNHTVQPQGFTPSQNNVGITVPGSVSDQKFTTVTMGQLEDAKHVIVLRLLGELRGQTVSEPVTVKAKPKCTSCGRVNKATAKFCTNCGTGLIII